MDLTDTERAQASSLLDLAADEFSNHGCNDYELPNTDEGRAMVVAMDDWNGTPDGDRQKPQPGETIFTDDFFVMRYLAAKLAKGVLK